MAEYIASLGEPSIIIYDYCNYGCFVKSKIPDN